jgi:hypothetical protein
MVQYVHTGTLSRRIHICSLVGKLVLTVQYNDLATGSFTVIVVLTSCIVVGLKLRNCEHPFMVGADGFKFFLCHFH